MSKVADLSLIQDWIDRVRDDADNLPDIADDIAPLSAAVLSICVGHNMSVEPIQRLAETLDAARLGRRIEATELELRLNAALTVAAAVRDKLSQRVTAETPAEVELTNVEFSRLTGSNAGNVSRRRKEGKPITLAAARDIASAKAATRRSDGAESDAAVERKFRDLDDD